MIIELEFDCYNCKTSSKPLTSESDNSQNEVLNQNETSNDPERKNQVPMTPDSNTKRPRFEYIGVSVSQKGPDQFYPFSFEEFLESANRTRHRIREIYDRLKISALSMLILKPTLKIKHPEEHATMEFQ